MTPGVDAVSGDLRNRIEALFDRWARYGQEAAPDDSSGRVLLYYAARLRAVLDAPPNNGGSNDGPVQDKEFTKSFSNLAQSWSSVRERIVVSVQGAMNGCIDYESEQAITDAVMALFVPLQVTTAEELDALPVGSVGHTSRYSLPIIKVRGSNESVIDSDGEQIILVDRWEGPSLCGWKSSKQLISEHLTPLTLRYCP